MMHWPSFWIGVAAPLLIIDLVAAILFLLARVSAVRMCLKKPNAQNRAQQ